MSAELSRRGLLRWGAAGALTVAVVTLHPTVAGADGSGAVLVPTLTGPLVPVFGSDATFVELPAELGFALPGGALGLGSITEIEVRFDAAVFALGPEVLIAVDGQAPVRVPMSTVEVEATGRSLVRVATSTLPSSSSVTRVVLGALSIPLAPDDQVDGVLPVQVDTVGQQGRVWSGTLGTDRRPGAPWGATTGVGWTPHESDAGLRSWCPSLVLLSAIGPEPIPAGAGVRIVVDRRSHPDAGIDAAFDQEGVAWPGTVRRSDVSEHQYELMWTSDQDLPADHSVQLGISCGGHTPTLTSEPMEAPLVQAVAPDGDWRQRHTGEESTSREDEIFTRAEVAAAVGV